jgi:predicted nucleic acid-binding protein
VDWNLDEVIWRTAGRAFQLYVARRRKQRRAEQRRILADLLIGAHAIQNGFRLLTMDNQLYRAAFPRLIISTV